MEEVSDKIKIEALERLLTAIVGRQEAKVEYRKDFEEQVRVIVKDCDPDDVVKIRSSLQTAEIELDFYVTEQEVPESERSEIFPHPYEGICEVTFYIEERYWKTIEEQKKRIAELEAKTQTNTINVSTSNFDCGQIVQFTSSG